MTKSKLPTGWMISGTKPQGYDVYLDSSQKSSNKSCACIQSNDNADSSGFGTMMQMFQAKNYIGKRLKLSATIKYTEIKGWAGLWMRIDGSTPESTLGFDNMQSRPLKGSSDWVSHSIVLDIPDNSKNIAFGVLLNGSGTIWIDEFKFETVGTNIPTTQSELPVEPMNIKFLD